MRRPFEARVVWLAPETVYDVLDPDLGHCATKAGDPPEGTAVFDDDLGTMPSAKQLQCDIPQPGSSRRREVFEEPGAQSRRQSSSVIVLPKEAEVVELELRGSGLGVQLKADVLEFVEFFVVLSGDFVLGTVGRGAPEMRPCVNAQPPKGQIAIGGKCILVYSIPKLAGKA